MARTLSRGRADARQGLSAFALCRQNAWMSVAQLLASAAERGRLAHAAPALTLEGAAEEAHFRCRGTGGTKRRHDRHDQRVGGHLRAGVERVVQGDAASRWVRAAARTGQGLASDARSAAPAHLPQVSTSEP